MRPSILSNVFSIRLRKSTKESLTGKGGGVVEGFGGLLTVFDCFLKVEAILGKDSCKPTL